VSLFKHIPQTRRPKRTELFLTVLIAVAVFAMGLIAASPELHADIHHDATDANHVCAITLASTGYCDTAATLRHFARHDATFEKLNVGRTSVFCPVPDFWHLPANGPPQARS
jgi:hypothetical protein